MRNDQQQADFRNYFTILGNRFSSLTRFQQNIWLQLFEHCLTENHDENRAPNTSKLSYYLLRDTKFPGYVENHF